MTQWEQIKKEYKDTPIPANGPQQVLESMAKAKQKRNRYKSLIRYGTVAAAVLLVILIVPRLFLFSGGAAKESADGFYMQDADVKNSASVGESESKENGGAANKAETPLKAPACDSASGPDVAESIVDESAPEDDRSSGELAKDGVALWAEKQDEISKEIINQMQLRMQEQNEIYYIKSEQHPDGFERLNHDQSYYISKEGLLVIVFAAGEVAPAEQGRAEFIIPAEVFLP